MEEEKPYILIVIMKKLEDSNLHQWWAIWLLSSWKECYPFIQVHILTWIFPGSSAVENLPALQKSQEAQVQSLDGEDSSLVNPMNRGACWVYSPLGHRVRHDWSDLAHTHEIS